MFGPTETGSAPLPSRASRTTRTGESSKGGVVSRGDGLVAGTDTSGRAGDGKEGSGLAVATRAGSRGPERSQITAAAAKRTEAATAQVSGVATRTAARGRDG